jgi:hypothetical protein
LLGVDADDIAGRTVTPEWLREPLQLRAHIERGDDSRDHVALGIAQAPPTVAKAAKEAPAPTANPVEKKK